MSKANDQANYCMNGLNALLQKDYRRAEELLLKALDLKNYNSIEHNLTLNSLIRLYFKMRDEWEGAYDKCLFFCQEQITLVASEECIKDHQAEWKCLPVGVGFERLVIEYERMGRYQDTISICEKAISLGQSDNTKGGFQGRIEKLKKKMGESRSKED